MDKHRSPLIDRYIGKRVRIEQPHGTYFGVLDYSDGKYYMEHPEYRSKNNEYHKWRRWSFRKSAVKVSKIHEIDADAVISKE